MGFVTPGGVCGGGLPGRQRGWRRTATLVFPAVTFCAGGWGRRGSGIRCGIRGLRMARRWARRWIWGRRGWAFAGGPRMVLLSDGVPEARAKRELLGFEKLVELTRLGAREIADAAQQFGQEDDITVLALALA